MARYSEAQTRATKKYHEKTYFRVTALVNREIEPLVRDRIDSFGSISGYINYLIRKDLSLENDTSEL